MLNNPCQFLFYTNAMFPNLKWDMTISWKLPWAGTHESRNFPCFPSNLLWKRQNFNNLKNNNNNTACNVSYVNWCIKKVDMKHEHKYSDLENSEQSAGEHEIDHHKRIVSESDLKYLNITTGFETNRFLLCTRVPFRSRCRPDRPGSVSECERRDSERAPPCCPTAPLPAVRRGWICTGPPSGPCSYAGLGDTSRVRICRQFFHVWFSLALHRWQWTLPSDQLQRCEFKPDMMNNNN